MGKLPGIPHLQAVRALEKAGFHVLRQGKHIVMTNGQRILTIPRHNPVNAFTMGELFAMPDSQSTNFAICSEVIEAMLDAFGSVESLAINI